MLRGMVNSGMNALEHELQEVNAATVRMLSLVREGVQLARLR
jgi:hypothetical protein